VDLHARNSGLRDKLVAERDVALTYALRALLDAGVAGHLAFKGGTCLRKLVFGSSGRFSEDLEFTLSIIVSAFLRVGIRARAQSPIGRGLRSKEGQS
jgi:predicted nucleotidyltransferase component of viral defense system